jgi:ankyrin repeat protein
MVGNTPLHLALESGHGDAAVVLIEAGADRERVSLQAYLRDARLTCRLMLLVKHLRILKVLVRRNRRG